MVAAHGASVDVEGAERLMPFFYESGEEIKAGDRVTYWGQAAEIELVADDEEQKWYGREEGGGVMIVELAPQKLFGRIVLHAPHTEEDLVFVARGEKR